MTGILSQFQRALSEYEERTGCRPKRIVCDRDALAAYENALTLDQPKRDDYFRAGHFFNGIPVEPDDSLTAAILVEGDSPMERAERRAEELRARANGGNVAWMTLAEIAALTPAPLHIQYLTPAWFPKALTPEQEMIVQHRKALFMDMLARWDAAAEKAKGVLVADPDGGLSFNWQPTPPPFEVHVERIVADPDPKPMRQAFVDGIIQKVAAAAEQAGCPCWRRGGPDADTFFIPCPIHDKLQQS